MSDWRTFFFLGGCVLFGGLLFVELAAPDTDEPPTPVARQLAEIPAAGHTQGALVDQLVAESLRRPLFIATRRPPLQQDAPPSIEQKFPDLRLTGVIIEPDRQLAIIAVPGAKPVVRAEGQNVEGWKLDRIAPRHVSLHGPAGITTLSLKTDPSIVRPPLAVPPAGPPTATAPGSVSRPFAASALTPNVVAGTQREVAMPRRPR